MDRLPSQRPMDRDERCLEGGTVCWVVRGREADRPLLRVGDAVQRSAPWYFRYHGSIRLDAVFRSLVIHTTSPRYCRARSKIRQDSRPMMESWCPAPGTLRRVTVPVA